MDDADRAIARQQQIWANLYGQARAAVLAEALADLLAARPDLTARQAAAALDPEDEDEYRDFVATRW